MREEETPASLLAKCRQALDGLKGAQYAGGDSITIHATRSTKTFTIPPYYYGTIPMTFTTATQLNAFIEVIFVDAPAEVYDCRKVLTPKDSKLNAFSIYCNSSQNANLTINLDVVILSTDTGVIA